MTALDDTRLTYTLSEAASLLGLTEGGLRCRVWRGTFPAVHLGRRVLVRREDLLRAIEPR